MGEWRYSSTHASTVHGGEWSASRRYRCTPAERTPGTHWIGGWVDTGGSLDAVAKRKIPTPTGNRHYEIPYHLLALPLLWFEIYSSTPCSQIPSVCVLPSRWEATFHARVLFLNWRREDMNRMVASILGFNIISICFVNVVLIWYCCFQIFELCHFFEISISYLWITILFYILVTKHEHVLYLCLCTNQLSSVC